jgi:NAD(P)-dependent dehydrogenase (short-subunit alcohol dehydrogenase family)
MSFAQRFLEGQVALVTGGGTGIGLAIAKGLAAHGARLVIASRKEDHLAAGAAEIRAAGSEVLAVKTNLREPEEVDRLMGEARQKMGGVDILINNAGANFVSPALGVSPNGWRTIVDVVLNGTFFMSKAYAQHRIDAQKPGCIVNIAATNGEWTGSPLIAASGAAKAGVLNLTRSLATEWGPANIRVNAISPGPVATDEANRRLWPREEDRRRMAGHVPLEGRLGTPEDSVGPVLFLCSPWSAFVTGAVIHVDGGEWLRRVPSW